MRCMLQEEELCVHIAAMEAKQKKAEHRRQRGELDAMRYAYVNRANRTI